MATHSQIAADASILLGREVTERFASSVLDGDPFVYDRCRREDDEAVGVVLGLATWRIPRPSLDAA